MQKNLFQQPVLLFKLVASVMYVIVGAMVLLIPKLIEDLGRTVSLALAALLIVYGIIRFTRAIKELRENREDSNVE